MENLLAGGKFSFPIDLDDGKVAIKFKKFGIRRAFTSTVLSEGKINSKIEPELSDLDFTNEVIVNGTRMPSLVVRWANTTLELGDGQSFAIAGQLAQTNRRNAGSCLGMGKSRSSVHCLRDPPSSRRRRISSLS